MAKALDKMSLDGLRQMRDDALAAQSGDGGPMTIGEYTAKFGEAGTTRAEHAAVIAQLDAAIAKIETTGSETLQ